MLLAKDLQDLMDAELDASKMAAKYLALVKTLDPTFRQTAVGAAVDPASGKKIEELENAAIENLRPGEDVVLASNPRPGTNFPPLIKLIMTLFAVVHGPKRLRPAAPSRGRPPRPVFLHEEVLRDLER